jgi:hypothetical protein
LTETQVHGDRPADDGCRWEGNPMRRAIRPLLASCALAALLVTASPAAADEYDPHYAGHPLRVLAYIVHPFGVALDYMIFRPAHWVGSHEPLRTIFGHTDY